MHYKITWAYIEDYGVWAQSDEPKITWTEVLLYDSSIHEKEHALVRAQLTLNSQDEATFQFDMPSTNAYFADIEPMKGYIIFWENEHIVCKGRISSITRNRGGVKSISGYGNIGLLKEALCSRIMRRYVGTYNKADDGSSAVYTPPTRSSSFPKLPKESSVRYKIQRILDIYNGQISDREISWVRDPAWTVRGTPQNEIEIDGIVEAVENEHNINIANTARSGGVEEDLYISREYDDLQSAFDWFSGEIIQKTQTHIMPVFEENVLPYKMNLHFYGSSGRLNETCVFRDGWNITDYKVNESFSDNACTILMPLGEDDKRVTNIPSDIETATGYTVTETSKFTVDHVSSAKKAFATSQSSAYSEVTTAKIVILDQDFKQQLIDNGYVVVAVTNQVARDEELSGSSHDIVLQWGENIVADPTESVDKMWVFAVRKNADRWPGWAKIPSRDVFDLPKSNRPINTNFGDDENVWVYLGSSDASVPGKYFVVENDRDAANLAEINVADGVHFIIRVPYIIWLEGLKKYGPIVRTEELSTSNRQALLNYGIDRMIKSIRSMISIDLKAQDPAGIDDNYAPSVPGEKVTIIIPEYSGQLVISSKTIDLSSGNCTLGFHEKDPYEVDFDEQLRRLKKVASSYHEEIASINGEILNQTILS